ncbi:MAG: cell division protein FtsA [Porphyromonas sp.]
MEKMFAVIALGSSYIRGMVASKLPNGRVNPIAYCQRSSKGCIIHGYIHNITDAAAIIGSIVDELNSKLQGLVIDRVYVGLDCQSMRSNLFKTKKDYGTEGIILEAEHIESLREEALKKSYSRQSVLKIASPCYYVDGKRENNPKGVRCHLLEATYQLITVREEVERNLYEVFENKLGLTVEEVLINPLAEAQVSLTREEMAIGCAYINIGGGTTSISLYRDKLLKALHVLPLGGQNVTKDLTNLKLLEQDAEAVKIGYGSVNLEVDKEERITAASANGTGDRVLHKYDVNRYIQARMEEITENIKALIQEIDPELMIAYLIFSGGATYLSGYIESLNLDVNGRQAKVRPDILSESAEEELLKNYQTALGLVVMATNNCVKSDVQDLDVVFNPTVEEPQEEPQEEEQPSTEEGAQLEDEEERGDRTFIDEGGESEEEYDDEESEEFEEDEDEYEDEDVQKESKVSQMFHTLRTSLKGLFSTNEEDNI